MRFLAFVLPVMFAIPICAADQRGQTERRAFGRADSKLTREEVEYLLRVILTPQMLSESPIVTLKNYGMVLDKYAAAVLDPDEYELFLSGDHLSEDIAGSVWDGFVSYHECEYIKKMAPPGLEQEELMSIREHARRVLPDDPLYVSESTHQRMKQAYETYLDREWLMRMSQGPHRDDHIMTLEEYAGKVFVHIRRYVSDVAYDELMNRYLAYLEMERLKRGVQLRERHPTLSELVAAEISVETSQSDPAQPVVPGSATGDTPAPPDHGSPASPP